MNTLLIGTNPATLTATNLVHPQGKQPANSLQPSAFCFCDAGLGASQQAGVCCATQGAAHILCQLKSTPRGSHCCCFGAKGHQDTALWPGAHERLSGQHVMSPERHTGVCKHFSLTLLLMIWMLFEITTCTPPGQQLV